VVTVFARNQAHAGKEIPPVMTGLRTADQVQRRLEGFLDQLTNGDASSSGGTADARARLITETSSFLEEHARQRTQVLDQVCQRMCQNQSLPSQARDRIASALANAQSLQAAAAQKAADARSKAHPPAIVPKPDMSKPAPTATVPDPNVSGRSNRPVPGKPNTGGG
jgi:hypothetical protein